MKIKRVNNKLPLYTDLHHLLAYLSKEYGERTVFCYRENRTVRITYSQLQCDISKLCRFFLDRNFKGKKIMLIGGNSYEYIAVFFAVICSGNILVPVCKDLCTAELEGIISDCLPDMVICLDRVREPVEKIREISHNALIFEISCIKNILRNEIKSEIPETENDDEVCCIVYTSGTSGKPKGVMLTQKGIIGNAWALSRNIAMKGKVLLCLPLHHMFAVTAGVLTPMYSGLNIVINSNPKELNQDLQEFLPENIYLVPAIAEFMCKRIKHLIRTSPERELYTALLESKETKQGTLAEKRRLFSAITEQAVGKLECIVSGAAALSKEYISFLETVGIETLCGYGMTECSPVISVNMHSCNRYGSIGIPLIGTEVRIDSNVTEGGITIGEILVKSPNVMKGYYQMPEETANVFDGEWLHTGDIGYIDSEGFLFITGRIKNLIIRSSGENVSPEELELLVSQIENVSEVLVHEEDGLIVASVFSETDSEEDTQRILDEVKQINSRLPSYKRIDRTAFVKCSFPRTSTNKIKRN